MGVNHICAEKNSDIKSTNYLVKNCFIFIYSFIGIYCVYMLIQWLVLTKKRRKGTDMAKTYQL